MQKLHSSYYMKLIIFSIILGTIPVIALGIYSYFSASKAILNRVVDGNMKFLESSHMGVENMLKTIDRSISQFIVSTEEESSLNRVNTIQDIGDVREIFNKMSKIQAFEFNIKYITLINMTHDWVLSTQYFQKLSDSAFSSAAPFYASQPGSTIWISGHAAEDENFKGAVSTDIRYIKKIPINSVAPTSLIIVDISSDMICKLLSNSGDPRETIIIDKNSRILADKNKSIIGKDISKEPYLAEIKKQAAPSGFFYTEMNGRKNVVAYLKSEYTGWTYLTLCPLDLITTDSRKIGIGTFIICVGFIAVVFVISFLWSRRMYYPIESIFKKIRFAKNENPDIKVKNELLYIGESIEDIVSTNKKITGQLQNQIQQLREYFIMNLFKGRVPASELEDRLNYYNYNTRWKWMCVMAVQIDTFHETGYSEKNQDLMLFAVNNIVGEIIPSDQRLSPVIIEQYQATLVGQNHDSDVSFKNYINSIAEMIQKLAGNYLNLKVSIGVSRPFENFAEATKAYQEAVNALKYRFYTEHEAILSLDDLHSLSGEKPAFPKSIENELLSSVRIADEKKALELLYEFIDNVFMCKGTLAEYQLPLLKLLTDLSYIAWDTGNDLLRLGDENKSLFADFFSLKTREAIEYWFKNFVITRIIRLIQEQQHSQSKRIASGITDIIEKEFDTDITLELLASRLNFHPSYLGQMFRKQVGVCFSDYLDKYRQQMAQKWLEETDMKISEIAERLKYSNSQNFIRHFKSEVGMTPGKYRQMRSP